jgi:hypothetical protein
MMKKLLIPLIVMLISLVGFSAGMLAKPYYLDTDDPTINGY